MLRDKTLDALASSLNFRQMRQELITSNVANADTPGYKTKRIDFEKALSRALDIDGQLGMKTSDLRHYNVGSGGFDNLEPVIYEDSNGIASEDGNTVDREREMALMVENRLLHDASVNLLNKKIGLIKYINSSER